MPDLILDITRLLDRFVRGRLHTGVDRVCLAYVRYMRERARAAVLFQSCLWIFPHEVSENLFNLILEPPRNPAFTLLRLVLRWGVTTWFPRNLEKAVLLNLGHSNLEHPAYIRALRRRHLRLVSFVHDLIPITHPEYCRPDQYSVHFQRMIRAVSLSSGIVANSRETLQSLTEFAEKNRLELPKGTSALLAPQVLPAPEARPPLPVPYFVMVGTIEPRKNHAFLLQVWRQLAQDLGPARTPHLVLIGQRGWECENCVDLLERCPALAGVVHEINSCSDQDMSTFLHHARALLFPSFAEGFGLPIAEALAHSVPVIASDLAVFREFAAQVPDYIHPLDGPRWLEVVSDYSLEESPLRNAQIARMSTFTPPSWQAHFVALEQLLAELHLPPAFPSVAAPQT